MWLQYTERVHEVRQCCYQDVTWLDKPGGRWPESSDCLCWWCCFPFEGPPAGVPVKKDERLDLFVMKGNFCSFECVLAWLRDRPGQYQTFPGGNVARLVAKTLRREGKVLLLKPAPSRESLKAFGGWMTIEEFRSRTNPWIVREARDKEPVAVWRPWELLIARMEPNAAKRARMVAEEAHQTMPGPSDVKGKQLSAATATAAAARAKALAPADNGVHALKKSSIRNFLKVKRTK